MNWEIFKIIFWGPAWDC